MEAEARPAGNERNEALEGGTHGMKFDWALAIEKNFEAMDRILALLLALSGIRSFRPFAATLPRHLHIRILSILRPAEYAARRLIAMVAATRSYPLPSHPEARVGAASMPGRAPRVPAPGRIPAFQLFDPFKPAGEPWLTPEQIAALYDSCTVGPVVPALPPDEPVDARALCLRIAALGNALDDLDGHARRLARWQARRHLASRRPRRGSPFRPGRPPGWVRHPKTEVEEVLKECDLLARDAWSTFDTS